jgi:hypothetical protein
MLTHLTRHMVTNANIVHRHGDFKGKETLQVSGKNPSKII